MDHRPKAPLQNRVKELEEQGYRYYRVRQLVWHTESLFELQVERGELVFTPGDCVSIFADDGVTSRPYSIASGIQEPGLRFLIRKMKGGVVTESLAKLRPGDQVKISSPFGWFRPGQHGTAEPSVFVATGTGIAPFLSYLNSEMGPPPLQIFYGVRYLNEALYLSRLQQTCPTFLAVSREQVTDYHHGRVTDLLPEFTLRPDAHYYLCGLDAMIEAVSRWLELHGIHPLNIYREVFFYAPHSSK